MLRKLGHEVYDFKNPAEGDKGFHWSEIDGGWQSWDGKRYKEALNHPVAERGFKSDFDAMEWADTFVLVQPCGRSAHLEMGWACGFAYAVREMMTLEYMSEDKKTIMLLGPDIEPELMVKMCDHICIGAGELLELFEDFSS